MLWRMPSMAKSSSAAPCASMAAARVGAVRDELGDHRIVIDRNLAALEHAGVVAHGDAVGLRLRRRAIAREASDGRQEIAERIFGIDARFHRPAGQFHVALLQRKLLACRDADHLLDEIDAGDEFGDRMLDLQPRVHLQKVEALVLPGDELDGAGGVVTDRLGERDGLRAHLRARGFIEQRRRRFLDDLLVAALDRAFALAQMNDIAVLVAEHLNFDVARIDDEFLDEDAIVAEGRLRLGLRARKAIGDFGLPNARCACPCRRRRRRP